MIIYAIRNRINDKIYIGQTVRSLENRWKSHLSEARRGDNNYIHCAMRKYGIDTFHPYVLMEVSVRKDLNKYEKIFISLFSSNVKDHGYNLTDGGDSFEMNESVRRAISKRMMGNKYGKGHKRSPEHIAKMQAARGESWAKGKKFSKEHKLKISESAKKRTDIVMLAKQMGSLNKGRKRSLEVRAKMGKHRIGTKHSPETIAKMSVARKAYCEQRKRLEQELLVTN